MEDNQQDMRTYELQLFFDADTEQELYDVVNRFDKLNAKDVRPHITMVKFLFLGPALPSLENLAVTTETISISLSSLDFTSGLHSKCYFSLFPAATMGLVDIHSKFCKELEAAGGLIDEEFLPGKWTARCPIMVDFKPHQRERAEKIILRVLKLPLASNITEVGMMEIVPGEKVEECFTWKLRRSRSVIHEDMKIFEVLLFFDPYCQVELHDTLNKFGELKITGGEDGSEIRPHITMVKCSFLGASPIACMEKLAESTETIPISLSGLDFSLEVHNRCQFFLRPTPAVSLLDIHSRFCKELEAVGGVILEDFRPGHWTAQCPITRAFKLFQLEGVHRDALHNMKLPIAANVMEVGLMEVVQGGGVEESFSCKLSGNTPFNYGVELYFNKNLTDEISEIRKWFHLLHIDNKLPVDRRPCLTILRFSLNDLDPSAVKELLLNFAANNTITPVSLALVNVYCGSDGSASLFVDPRPSRSLINFHGQLCDALQIAGAVIPRDFQPQSWIAKCTVAEGLKSSEMNDVYRSIINNLTLPINGMGVEIGFVKYGKGQLDFTWTKELSKRKYSDCISQVPIESSDDWTPIGTEVRLIFNSELEKLLDEVKQLADSMKMSIDPAAQPFLTLVYCFNPPSQLMNLLEEFSSRTKPVPVSLCNDEGSFQGSYQFNFLASNFEVRVLQRKLWVKLNNSGIKLNNSGVNVSQHFKPGSLQSLTYTMARYNSREDYRKVAENLKGPLNGHGVELCLVRVFESKTTSRRVYKQMWSYKLSNN